MRKTDCSRLILAAVLAAGVTIALSGRSPEAQQLPDRVPPALLARVADGTSIKVIVGVDAPQADVRRVDGTSALLGRQQATRVAVDAVLDAAAANGVHVDQRYDNFPFFAAHVDRQALEWLAANPAVTSVRAPAVARPLLAESVPLIHAPQAWAAGATGAGWYVAVVDTGVEKTHAFLSGKVAVEGCASGGELDETDPRALTDGVSLCPPMPQANTPPVRINRWWGAGSGVPCTGYDDCDHGTHVAGIAVGGTGNGVSGVAPGAGLFAIMGFRLAISAPQCSPDPAPCVIIEEDSILESFDHVFTEHFLSLNEHVAAVNLSFGGGIYPTRAACDAAHPSVTYAINSLRNMGGLADLGIATVAASGNDGSVFGLSWPACISGAISVGATTKGDTIATLTNRFSFLSLLAPGESITSSVPGNAFGAMDGTSQAAPHVAGAWAVLKQARPAATVTEILNALRTTGVPINDPFAIPAAQYRRIDVNAARLNLLGIPPGPTAPAPPINLAATVNGPAATVSWAPGVGGGLPTHYLVVAGTTPGGNQLGLFNVGLTTTVSSPLAAGTYYVRVIAANAAGQSAPSAEASFTVGGIPPPPGTPGSLAATINGTTVSLAWNAPGAGGTVGNYLLIASLTPGGPAIATIAVAATGLTVTNVPPGNYYVRVIATNSGGSSAASNEVVVSVGVPPPPPPPGAPTALAHSGGQGSVQLRWTAPATGAAPTSYRIQAGSAPGLANLADVLTGATTIFNTAGVPAGVYFVRVLAVTTAGTSSPSNEIAVIVGGPGCSGQLDVILRWNTGSPTGSPTSVDMDLHAYEPNGTHVYFGNRDGASLRLVDDEINGLGPELICAPGSLLPGDHEIDVVAYGGNQWPTTATIWISTDSGAHTASFTRTFVGPDRSLAQRVATVGPDFTIAEAPGTRAVDRLSGTAKRRP